VELGLFPGTFGPKGEKGGGGGEICEIEGGLSLYEKKKETKKRENASGTQKSAGIGGETFFPLWFLSCLAKKGKGSH